ncbi:hypothetical protein [Mucilaginibacter gynuensis]
MMKSLKTLYLLLIVLLSGSLYLQSCKKEAASLSKFEPIEITKLDTLHIFNLLPDSSFSPMGYALYAISGTDTSMIYSNSKWGIRGTQGSGIPPIMTLPHTGGTYRFKVAKIPNYSPISNKIDERKVICTSAEINIPPNSGFNNLVLYAGPDGKYDVKYIPMTAINEPPPVPGKFKVRIVNFGYHLPVMRNTYELPYDFPNSTGKQFPVSLQYADSTAVSGLQQVPYGSTSNYAEVPYGMQQLLLFNQYPDSLKYFNYSGKFNNLTSSFGIAFSMAGAGEIYFSVHPFYTDPSGFFQGIGSNAGNRGSYPFNAGACYSIYVFGNMYNVILDKQYGANTLDDFGKVQVVNANPGQQDLQLTMKPQTGETHQYNSLPFGKYTAPITVPSGNVTCTFTQGGRTLYTYDIKIPRLANYTLYYTADQNNTPQVFQQSNNISTTDYQAPGYAGPGYIEPVKFKVFNLCADAGNMFVTSATVIGGTDTRMTADMGYKSYATESNNTFTAVFDGRVQLQPATFNLRLSTQRPDTLASKKVFSIESKAFFPLKTNPGNYTMAAIGLLNTADEKQKLRLIMIKHTNYTNK